MLDDLDLPGRDPEPGGPGKAPSAEDLFAAQCDRFLLPPFVRQHPFARGRIKRQWRYDFAWPEYHLGLEIQGVVVDRFKAGGHNYVPQMRRDYEKQNAAVLLGWSTLQFLTSDVESKLAINTTIRVLCARGWKQP